MSEFAKRLAKMKEMWDGNKQAPRGFQQNVPDGRYTFRLQSAELRESASGNLIVSREHLVLDGEAAGEVFRDNLQVEHEVGQRITMQWIEQMGFEIPDNPSELEEVVSAIAEAAPSYLGTIKTTTSKKDGNDYTNLRILRLLDSEGEEQEEEETVESRPARGRAEEPEEQEEAGEEADDSDDSADSDAGQFEELKAFCEAQDIAFDEEEATKADLVKAIDAYEWNRDELSSEEVELLEGIGVTLIGGKPKKASAPAAAAPKNGKAKAVQAKAAPAKKGKVTAHRR